MFLCSFVLDEKHAHWSREWKHSIRSVHFAFYKARQRLIRFIRRQTQPMVIAELALQRSRTEIQHAKQVDQVEFSEGYNIHFGYEYVGLH